MVASLSFKLESNKEDETSPAFVSNVDRGTSLIRNSAPLGPYHRTVPRPRWWFWGGVVFYERGTPVGSTQWSTEVVSRPKLCNTPIFHHTVEFEGFVTPKSTEGASWGYRVVVLGTVPSLLREIIAKS